MKSNLSRLLRAGLSVIALLLLCNVLPARAAGAKPKPIASLEELRAQRQQAANRPRRLIFNNDGNEPVYQCRDTTPEELLKHRTAPLLGSQVDSIFYATWSSGFGMFTHDTKVGQVFETREHIFSNNFTRAMLDAGTDPLRVMADFGKKHGIEIFWSFRPDDTHDAGLTDYGPAMFRPNRLKQQHPEWLMGTPKNPPKVGRWSAVDYGVPEVRDYAFRFVEEVCQNYDVDGVEIDFFRHTFFFRPNSTGAPCGEVELNQMTELLRRIRAMTEAEGMKRGRPLLVAVRAPDSVEYCRFVGLDLERWLREGLVDLLTVGGYTQLNPWEYSVALARQHGVKVYASLDESRVKERAARTLRQSPPGYRARALNAWDAGMDGVYLFNLFNPRDPLWKVAGDPAVLARLDKDYVASPRGVGHMFVPHREFLRVPTLNPDSPIVLSNAAPVTVPLRIGDDVEAARAAGQAPTVTLRLRFKNLPAADNVRVKLNDAELAAPKQSDDWLEFRLQPGQLRRGSNAVTVTVDKVQKSVSWLDLQCSIRYPNSKPAR